MMSQLRAKKYTMEDNTPVSTVPKVLGKRPAPQPKKAKESDPAVKKRDKKEESKDEPVRKSTRQIGYKPIYDEAEIAKLIAGADADKSRGKEDGAINVMLAQTYDPDRDDPTGWLMSEKLDGVRCYWDGSKMFTRNGNKIFAPKEWIAKLPSVALDGELWSGRDSFQQIVSTVRRHEPDSDKWKDIKFMVFDGPLLKGSFSKRIKALEAEISSSNSIVKLID